MRTLVIGAGPIGLEAATAAHEAGSPTLVVDQGRVGAGVRTWSANRSWSPWPAWTGPAGRRALGEPQIGTPRGSEIVADWLEPLAARLEVWEHTRVTAVGLRGDGFRVVLETADGERRFEDFDRVLDAAGPGAWAPAGGDLPLPSENRAASAGRLRYGPVDPGDLPTGEILVIGSGPAAGVMLAEIAASRTAHWAPGPSLARLPSAESSDWSAIAERLEGVAFVRHDAIERFGRSAEGVVVFAGAERFHVAQVVACTGHRLDFTWVRGLPWAFTAGRLTVDHPRYVLLGARA